MRSHVYNRLCQIALLWLAVVLIAPFAAFGEDDVALAPTAVEPQDPAVWAGVSASVQGATSNAMFSVKETDRLMIGVGLINDSGAALPMDLAASRLIINGVSVEIFDGSGPVWEQLAPDKSFQGSTGGLGKHFSRPGLYRLQWKGKGFVSAVLELRIVDD